MRSSTTRASPRESRLAVGRLERHGGGTLQRAGSTRLSAATPIAVAGRTIVAEGAGGSLAVFPAPHRYFYPQDEAFNLKFVWHGRDYGGTRRAITASASANPSPATSGSCPGSTRPPDTEQHLGVFYLLTRGDARQALDAVARYTHGDRFKPLPGRLTFTSHYHVEHTLEFLRKQKEQDTTGVPRGLETPGLVKTFKARGVNIVHLAEFHNGRTPKLADDERLPQLKTLHDECARLSDGELLVLPGEEANVHLGGHWLSFFPRPVYWVLNRPAGRPFAEQVEGYGTVYHVGSPADVLRLMEAGKRPDVDGARADQVVDRLPRQVQGPGFLPLRRTSSAPRGRRCRRDLSRPTLGWRVLDLFDDMSNWGLKKQVIGEADLFRMEPDFETYAHLNINYLKLDKLPRFGDGWQPVLDTLRGGRFFTSTGEVLIPEFTVGGKESGQTLDLAAGPRPVLEASLEWTFPMSFAEVISGDGKQVYRERIDLADTEDFGTRKLQLPIDLKGRTWVASRGVGHRGQRGVHPARLAWRRDAATPAGDHAVGNR